MQENQSLVVGPRSLARDSHSPPELTSARGSGLLLRFLGIGRGEFAQLGHRSPGRIFPVFVLVAPLRLGHVMIVRHNPPRGLFRVEPHCNRHWQAAWERDCEFPTAAASGCWLVKVASRKSESPKILRLAQSTAHYSRSPAVYKPTFLMYSATAGSTNRPRALPAIAASRISVAETF